MCMTELFDAHASRDEVFKAQAGDMAADLGWDKCEISPNTQARIPILDQGFLHSDATYDVPAAWNGWIFRFEDRLDRLAESCASPARTPKYATLFQRCWPNPACATPISTSP